MGRESSAAALLLSLELFPAGLDVLTIWMACRMLWWPMSQSEILGENIH